MTNYDHLSKTIESNGGYITRKDINAAQIPSATLYSYAKKHNLIKYCTGFYAEESWVVDDCFLLQYQYPKLIFSFYTAAFLNNLGDYIPQNLEVTAPKNYRPFPLPRKGVILHTDTKDDTYNLGVTEVITNFGNKVRVYDIEKTVCDFIKYRDKIDSESFVKCLRFYKKRKDKDVIALIKYARVMKIESKVNELMEVVLNDD